jgi:hypothetical protein
MALLAHWTMNDSRARSGSVAVDVAAGGSGSHSGTYGWGSSDGQGCILPGGGLLSTYQAGNVHSMGNLSDLNQLHGSATFMFWIQTQQDNGWYPGNRYIANCSVATWASEADNRAWYIAFASNDRKPGINWQYGATPTNVTLYSSVPLPAHGRTHVAIVRFQTTPGYFGVKWYYNGVLVDTQDNGGAGWPEATGGSNCQCFIGRNGAGLNAYYAHYILEDVRVYDSEETQENIEAVYNEENQILVREEGPFSVREDAGFTGF